MRHQKSFPYALHREPLPSRIFIQTRRRRYARRWRRWALPVLGWIILIIFAILSISLMVSYL